jgi:hypothetical protein
MKTVKFKKVAVSLVVMSMMCVVIGCNQTSNEMQIKNINSETGAFDFVDVHSGKVLSYNKLLINNHEVVQTQCLSIAVNFVYEEFRVAGNAERKSIAYTVHAKLKYELKDAVLNMVVDLPVSDNSNKSTEKTVKEEKQLIRFKGGTCELFNINFSSAEEHLELVFECTLDDKTDKSALAVLDKGLVVSKGKTYKPRVGVYGSNGNRSYYKLTYHFSDAISKDDSIKFVFNEQKISLSDRLFKR